MGILIGIGDTAPVRPDSYFYGIEWDVTVSNPQLTRIGKMELHRELPIQSKMRRCLLLDDGTVNYYLHPNDSTKKEDESPAKLDGTDGQVMVEIPTFYVRFESEGNKRRCLMSEYPLAGFHKWSKLYVSAYEATIHRPTNKLSSVVSTTADYRGGDNNASKDGKFNSQLGRPATNYSLTQARTYARNRGSVYWNCYAYQAHKELFWLFTVEYATFNSQDDHIASVDVNGYKKGGLGKGVTDLTDWGRFGNFPPVPCGVTNSLGNKSGYVEYVCAKSDDNSLAPQTLHVNSYRGVENPFGHVWKMVDGAICSNTGGKNLLLVSAKIEQWGSNIKYDSVGEIAMQEGYIKELLLGDDGEIAPKTISASSSTYLCDYFYTNDVVGNKVIIIGGASFSSDMAGLAFLHPTWFSGSKDTTGGTRLCFIP